MQNHFIARCGKALGIATVFSALSLVACSSSSGSANASSTDGGTTLETGSVSCTENFAVDLAVIPAASPAVAITPDGSKIFMAWVTGAGTSKTVMIAIYGADGSAIVAPKALITTAGSSISVAASSDGLAIAWEDELPPATGLSAYPVTFFTALGFDGTPASQPSSNDSTGLSGATDYVSASSPQVVATSSGYVVTWNDTRTLYPAVEGENLADADGIYARHFGQNGVSTDSQDVQVMQNGHSLWSVSGGATASVLWEAYGNNGNPEDGSLQLATTLGSSTAPPTLGVLGSDNTFSLFSASDGTFPVALTGNLGANASDATGLLIADATGKPSPLIIVDESASPHSNAQVFSQNGALGLVWLEGLSSDPSSTDSSIQVRAASYDTAVENARDIGATAQATYVTVGTAAVVGSIAYVPVVAITHDKQAHLELATICPAP